VGLDNNIAEIFCFFGFFGFPFNLSFLFEVLSSGCFSVFIGSFCCSSVSCFFSLTFSFFGSTLLSSTLGSSIESNSFSTSLTLLSLLYLCPPLLLYE